jgi:hypothetical protein
VHKNAKNEAVIIATAIKYVSNSRYVPRSGKKNNKKRMNDKIK